MNMTNTEIKKALYKQKPTANFKFIRMGHAYYDALVNTGETDKHGGLEVNVTERVVFKVPVDDMGSADFFPTMEGQHLNRWILDSNEEDI